MKTYYDNDGNITGTSKRTARQGGVCGCLTGLLLLAILVGAIIALAHS